MKIKRIWLPPFVNAMYLALLDVVLVNKNKSYIEHLIEHEVCHGEQRKRYGLPLYLWVKTGSNILQLFGIRSGIEMEAYARQDKKYEEIRGR